MDDLWWRPPKLSRRIDRDGVFEHLSADATWRDPRVEIYDGLLYTILGLKLQVPVFCCMTLVRTEVSVSGK